MLEAFSAPATQFEAVRSRLCFAALVLFSAGCSRLLNGSEFKLYLAGGGLHALIVVRCGGVLALATFLRVRCCFQHAGIMLSKGPHQIASR